MKKTLCIVALLLIAAASSQARTKDVNWSLITKFVQKDVRIITQTPDTIVLYHPGLQDTIVVTSAFTAESDIYFGIEERRGGNPYRIIVASDRFWNHPEREHRVWGRFFRSQLLRILRPPQETG